MRNFLLIQILFFLALTVPAGNNPVVLPQGVHEVVVKEVVQTTGYTYLLVIEQNVEKWFATSKIEAIKGDVYYYNTGFLMKDFKSKELNKTFPEIFFLDNLRKTPEIPQPTATVAMPQDATHKAISDSTKTTKQFAKKIDAKIEPIAGGVTIAELFSKKDSYAGKTIKIKAQVTKLSAEIMKKNWIHLQDGTEFEGKFDMTATTDSLYNVGDVVIFEGKVSLNKDFGYGYFYDILLEDATPVNK